MASGDLYALPVTAVPGCGFLLGMLLKREAITRASDLYEVFTKQKTNFPKYLSCKFGPWNMVYAKTGSTMRVSGKGARRRDAASSAIVCS